MVLKLNNVTGYDDDNATGYGDDKVRLFRFAVKTPDEYANYNRVTQWLVLESGKPIELYMGIVNDKTLEGGLSIGEELLEFTPSNTAGGNIDYKPPQGQEVTVRQVWDTLKASHFDDYDFLSNKYGREYFYVTALKLLETQRLVSVGSATDLLMKLRSLYSRTSANLRELIPGQFRREGSRGEADELWGKMHQELKTRLDDCPPNQYGTLEGTLTHAEIIIRKARKL